MNEKLAEILNNGDISAEENIIKEVTARFKVEFFNFLLKRTSQKYLCEIKFDDGHALFKVFEALEKINTRAIFQITPKYINAYTTNDSKTYIIQIILKVNDQNFSFFKSSDQSINITDLMKTLKCSKSENITSTLRFKENQLEVELYSKRHKSKISRIIKEIQNDFEKDDIIEDLKKLSYSGYFILDKGKFLHILSQAGRISEVIKLELTSDFVCLSEHNLEGNSEIRWDKTLLSELKVISDYLEKNSLNAYFSVENLKSLTPFLFEVNPLIKFYIKEEIPIKIHVNFESLEDSYGLLFLAQRDKNAYI